MTKSAALGGILLAATSSAGYNFTGGVVMWARGRSSTDTRVCPATTIVV